VPREFLFSLRDLLFSGEVGLKQRSKIPASLKNARSQLNASKAANGSSNASSEANPRKSQEMVENDQNQQVGRP
jgi:hypothetical protein